LPTCYSPNKLSMDISVWLGLPCDWQLSWLAYAVCQHMDHELVFERFRSATTREQPCFTGNGWCRVARLTRPSNTNKCFNLVIAALFAGVKSYRTDLASVKAAKIKQSVLSNRGEFRIRRRRRMAVDLNATKRTFKLVSISVDTIGSN
jgi:hypothetical protein